MKPKSQILLRCAEALCGLAVFFLALYLWRLMFLWTPADARKFNSEEAWFMLLFVAPGLGVAIGSSLQAAYRWVWPTALVLVSAVAAVRLGLGFLLFFRYTGHASSLPAVYLYLILILVTVLASLVFAFIELVLRFAKRREEQMAGLGGAKNKDAGS